MKTNNFAQEFENIVDQINHMHRQKHLLEASVFSNKVISGYDTIYHTDLLCNEKSVHFDDNPFDNSIYTVRSRTRNVHHVQRSYDL